MMKEWFNNFWYGSLELDREMFWNAQLRKKACVMRLGELLSGQSSFFNLETWGQHNDLLRDMLFPIRIWRVEELRIVERERR